MTKEEYIKKEKDILERAIRDTFKDDPVGVKLIPLKPYKYVNNTIIHHTGIEKYYCPLCKNNTFFVSHIKPRTIICSECFDERYIDSSMTICTKRAI